jgi:predicted outer membrane protein
MKLSRAVLCAAAAAALGAGPPARAQMPTGAVRDTQVLLQLHHINEQEIAIGRYAQKKAGKAEIRRYATLLEADHKFFDKRIVALARERGVPMVTLPLSAEEQTTFEKVQAANTPDFDKAFLDAMRAGHLKAMALVDEAQRKAQDPGLRSLLRKMRPILGQHHRLSEDLLRT